MDINPRTIDVAKQIKLTAKQALSKNSVQLAKAAIEKYNSIQPHYPRFLKNISWAKLDCDFCVIGSKERAVLEFIIKSLKRFMQYLYKKENNSEDQSILEKNATTKQIILQKPVLSNQAREAFDILTKFNNLDAKNPNDSAKIGAVMELYDDFASRCYPNLKYINSHITLTYEGYLDYNSELKFEEAKGILENYIKKRATSSPPQTNKSSQKTNPLQKNVHIRNLIKIFLGACTVVSTGIGIYQCVNEEKSNANNADENKTQPTQQQQNFEYEIKRTDLIQNGNLGSATESLQDENVPVKRQDSTMQADNIKKSTQDSTKQTENIKISTQTDSALFRSATTLLKDANAIDPKSYHVSGYLIALIDGYNKIAPQINEDSVQPYSSKDDDGLDALTKYGIAKLQTIKWNLLFFVKKYNIKKRVKTLLNEANAIDTKSYYVSGYLIALIDGYNKIAPQINEDLVQPYSSEDDDGLDALTKYGVAKLKTIISNLTTHNK